MADVSCDGRALSRFNRHISSRTYCNSDACRRQCWCVVDSVADHRDIPAAGLKALHRRSLASA